MKPLIMAAFVAAMTAAPFAHAETNRAPAHGIGPSIAGSQTTCPAINGIVFDARSELGSSATGSEAPKQRCNYR